VRALSERTCVTRYTDLMVVVLLRGAGRIPPLRPGVYLSIMTTLTSVDRRSNVGVNDWPFNAPVAQLIEGDCYGGFHPDPGV